MFDTLIRGGTVIDGTGRPVNPTGFTIHGAVHAARPEAACVMHLHTEAGVALSMLVSGARFAMDRREYLVINARDVSEAERERLQREAILQNASIGIAVTRGACFVLANPRFDAPAGDRTELLRL